MGVHGWDRGRSNYDTPGHALTTDDRAFEARLIGWLRFHRGMLIGEILPYVYRYLRDNPAAPERALFDHILVDEYQDLNKAEQGVIDLLGDTAEVCIVGDDDQSLYSFKHAHPAGIREFDATHQPTEDHAVIECRRCPSRIVALANALISHNVDRAPRQLIPRAEYGRGEVSIIQYDTLEAEATRIAELVGDLIDNRGYRPQDILLLAQRRSVGNPIHDALTGRNIPSKSYYQEGLLDNVAAQERLAVLKLFIDPNDRIALRWLLGYGSDDFRKNAYARLRAHCEQSGAEPWDALAQIASGELRIPYTQPLVERYRAIRAELDTLRAHATLQEFVPAWLQDQVDENDPFHGLVLELSLRVETPDELLGAVIQAVSQPDVPPDVTEVRIMSLHKSKGLSSPVVIIAGCVEGLLPTADGKCSLA